MPLTFVVVVVFVSLLVLGCTYNNSRYANGSFVPTTESCLSCKCINANLICALRVCPDQPFPPPRGCVIVQKRDSCCPYMTCSKFQPFPKDQDKRTDITHDAKLSEQNLRNRLLFSPNAVQRRIEDSNEDGNQFGNGKSKQSKRFDEKTMLRECLQRISLFTKYLHFVFCLCVAVVVCVHNGTVYRSGSAMTTSSLCSYCYCIEGVQKCVQPKCTLPPSDCEPISIDSACCPVRYDCTENKSIKAKYNAKFKRRRTETTNKHYLRMTSRMQRSRGEFDGNAAFFGHIFRLIPLNGLKYVCSFIVSNYRLPGEFKFLSRRTSFASKRNESV